MSIASDLRGYADDALEKGKKVVDQVVGQARDTQLTDVTGQANEFLGKLADTAKDNATGLRSKAAATASDLRTQAEERVDVSAIKDAVEPYVTLARGYAESVTNTISAQADSLLATARKDKRFAALLDSAESVTGVVVETVQERVVEPARQLLGTATPRRKRAKAAAKPATAKPASGPARQPAATASATGSGAKSTTKSPVKSTATRAPSAADKA